MKPNTYDAALSEPTAKASEHVVLIGGDLKGANRAAAFAFANRGNHIVLAGTNDDAGLALTRELRARNADAAFVHADTHNEAEMRSLIDVTVQHYGHLDVQYLQ